MKQQYKIILLLFLFGCSNNQKNNGHFNKSTSVNPITFNDSFSRNKKIINLNYQDTTFILRELEPEFYHKVYIERNKSSVYYQMLTNFNFDKYEL